MLLDEWLAETAPSAIPRQVKELLCYLTVAQWAQAHQKRIWCRNLQGHEFELEHAKVISLSCILTGDPGSYKSEGVRFVKKVCKAYNDLLMEKVPKGRLPIPIFPYDKVTNEFLLTELAQQSKNLPESIPCTTTIIIDELINFLNKREYVEPLIGTLNSLLDQPPEYNVGTQKRQAEMILNPLTALVAACAPSWFRYLPEALFTGGYSGRCMFYGVPYPKDEDRQPFGKVSHTGAANRLARTLIQLPLDQITLTHPSIKIYEGWDREFGKQKAHPIQAIDEWFKRRAVQGVRLASCIALSRSSVDVLPDHMHESNIHMEWVLKTLENVWEELDSDDSIRFRVLLGSLALKREFGEIELMDEVMAKMRSTGRSINIIQYMKQNGILAWSPHTKKWIYNG